MHSVVTNTSMATETFVKSLLWVDMIMIWIQDSRSDESFGIVLDGAQTLLTCLVLSGRPVLSGLE
jgi:hypothetical protein